MITILCYYDRSLLSGHFRPLSSSSSSSFDDRAASGHFHFPARRFLFPPIHAEVKAEDAVDIFGAGEKKKFHCDQCRYFTDRWQKTPFLAFLKLCLFFRFPFAFLHLYKRVCPSLGRSIGQTRVDKRISGLNLNKIASGTWKYYTGARIQRKLREQTARTHLINEHILCSTNDEFPSQKEQPETPRRNDAPRDQQGKPGRPTITNSRSLPRLLGKDLFKMPKMWGEQI